MTPEKEQELTHLIGGTAETSYAHASSFMGAIADLETDDQIVAIELLLTRFKVPQYRHGAHVGGDSIPNEKFQELNMRLAMMVEGTLRYITSNRMSVGDAAREIHRLLSARRDLEEKSFCIVGVMAANSVPYAPIPQTVTTLSNERYQSLQRDLVSEIAKIRTISSFARDYAEEADLILSVVEGQAQRENKVAVLCYYVAMVNDRKS